MCRHPLRSAFVQPAAFSRHQVHRHHGKLWRLQGAGLPWRQDRWSVESFCGRVDHFHAVSFSSAISGGMLYATQESGARQYGSRPTVGDTWAILVWLPALDGSILTSKTAKMYSISKISARPFGSIVLPLATVVVLHAVHNRQMILVSS